MNYDRNAKIQIQSVLVRRSFASQIRQTTRSILSRFSREKSVIKNMDYQDSLYGLLCRFFEKVYEGEVKSDVSNTIDQANGAVSQKNLNLSRQKLSSSWRKRKGFQTLMSSLELKKESSEESTNQIYAYIYNLRKNDIVSSSNLDTVEELLRDLECQGLLGNVLPVLKLLIGIKPKKIETQSQLVEIGHQDSHLTPLKSHRSENSMYSSPFAINLYTNYDHSLFSAQPAVFQAQSYPLPISNFSSLHQFSKLDIEHRNLFGALTNPPKSLDFIGISSESRLLLSIRDLKEPENKEIKHPQISPGDEGYVSKTSSPRPQTPESQPDISLSQLENWENEDVFSPIKKSWESHFQGDLYSTEERPYSTEAPIAIMEHICQEWEKNVSLVDVTFQQRQVVRIEESELRRHLLYLTTGIESTLFVFEHTDQCFRLNVPCTIDGLSVDCLAHVLGPFFECGSIVRRLNEAERQASKGLIFNALVEQIQQMLLIHQQAMGSLVTDTKSLMGLAVKMKTLLEPLRLINQLLAWPWKEGTGWGVSFLQHVLRLSTRTTNRSERRLLTAIFCACIRPFLAYLQRWLYRGECCDPHGEFPVNVADAHLSRRDRAYWTQGFALRDIFSGDTPGNDTNPDDDGLYSLLADIYVCGKSVHLLQLCTTAKGQENIGEPPLRIALSLDELDKILKRCEEYADKNCVKDVVFIERSEDVAKEAQKQRDAKLVELEEALRVQKETDAAAKTQRQADYKAKLDAQLEAKRLEDEKKRLEDQTENEKIKEYQDKLIKREEEEKLRLMSRYANLLGGDNDENVVIDGRDERNELVISSLPNDTNANENNAFDEENNTIDAGENPKTAEIIAVRKINSATISTALWDTAVSMFDVDDDDVGTARKSRFPRFARRERYVPTLQEIKAKVMRVEFGFGEDDYAFNDKKNAVEAPVDSESFRAAMVWQAPSPPNITSYPASFNFDIKPFSSLKEPSDWLRETRPDEEQVADLSLTFFVERSLLLPIRTQCQLVNRSLMGFFVEEQKLMKHLEMLRQFLFLDNGSFGRSLVSNIGPRLNHVTTLIQLINIPSMNFILQSALSAVRADESYATHLSFYIKEIGPRVATNSVEALDCFTLRYRIGWPLNLILTDEIMDDYSLIFSFLLQLRLAAWAMEDVYIGLKELGRKWHAVQIARQSMYHFVQTLQHYVMNQLLNLSWQEFVTDLEKNASSLDDLYDIHWRYIHQAKSRLLLTGKSASLMKIIRDALNLTLKFRSRLVACDYNHSPTVEAQIATISRKFGEYAKFLHLVLEKVNDRSHQCHLSELLILFNYNGYYSNS